MATRVPNGSIGRVGLLALFLGVGSLAGWTPAAAAEDDTVGAAP
ncbi:MAG: hypothetical protein QG655_131, partial [Actinomycetota bacterium]|nr:hypothetical protein [Actinomycetota bacterium]